MGTVPLGGLLLVGAADVQKDRIEASIWAFGRGKESWLIEHRVLMGDTARDVVWKALAGMLAENWTHASGGGGYATGALRAGHRLCHAGGLCLRACLPRPARDGGQGRTARCRSDRHADGHRCLAGREEAAPRHQGFYGDGWHRQAGVLQQPATAVFAGDRKNDLNPHEPISSEAHAFLKAEVNRIYGLFVETVARQRGIEASAVRDTEAGLFFGQAAVAMGLADAVGTFDDALAQLLASLSPNPTPVAVATRAGFLSNHPKESLMNDRTDPAALDRPLADPAGSSPQSPAATLSVADAIEIAQTCTLAGRADLIAGFLEANTAPATVRSQLLSAKAEASPEIVSRIAPDAARPAPANPLLEAARNLAAQSSALKKEI